MNWLIKILSSILLMIFLSVMLFSLLNTFSGAEKSDHLTMGGCLFMSHDEMLCDMSFGDHLAVWKNVFLGIVPATFLILSMTALVMTVIAPRLLTSRIKLQIYRCLKPFSFLYICCPRALQELFSNGILHPKLF